MTKAATFGAVLLMTALAQFPARANTYLFSFTAAQVEAALQSSPSTSPYFSESLYYAIFLQPDSKQFTQPYTYTVISKPNPDDAGAGQEWDTAAIQDPSNPPAVTNPSQPLLNQTCPGNTGKNCWAGFFKDSTSTATSIAMDGSAVHPDVTVLAGTAAAALYDVSAGFSWEDANPSPYGFGGMSADFAHDFYSNGSFSGQVINKVMLPNDVFSFSITTSQVITGPLRVQGLAGALLPASYDGAGRSVTFTKSENFGFEMATPEPGTWATLGGGVLLLLGLARRRRAHAVNS